MKTAPLTKEELKERKMEPHAIKAFLALQKMGIDVRVWDEEDRGHFWIDCEENSEATYLNIDYYSLYWGSEKINKILDDNGLYFEWYNPAYACIYNND